MVCRLVLFLIISFASHEIYGQDITYPENSENVIHGLCTLNSGDIGLCRPASQCKEVFRMFAKPNHCGWRNNWIPIVCCPLTIGRSNRGHLKPTAMSQVKTVSKPRSLEEGCGDPTVRVINLADFSQGSVDFNDEFREDKENEIDRRVFILRPESTDSLPAKPEVASYVALLGERVKNSQDIIWFCDGVLVNYNWVLTAAHCLERRNPDIVRVGEYDSSDPNERGILDRKVAETHVFPEYITQRSYHDLALLKLEFPVSNYIKEEGQRDFVGAKATLTGWGATEFGGERSPVLREVVLTVFETSRCHDSYVNLPSFEDEYPNGMSSNETLCAGDPIGEGDACQGDSGGPLAYKNKEGNFTLLGIVSKGYGCGNDMYPGIYVPVNKIHYLSWIKKVAFGE